MSRAAPTLILVATFALALAPSVPGCAKQGEGERCSPKNDGSGDCADGLVCRTDLGFEGICCPAENPTTPECSGQGKVPDAGADIGGGGAGGADAAGDAVTEPAADSDPDADGLDVQLPDVPLLDGGGGADAAPEEDGGLIPDVLSLG